MAIARKCDRCKKYYDGRIHKVTVRSPSGFDIIEDEYDICGDCISEFETFIKNNVTFNDTGKKTRSVLHIKHKEKGHCWRLFPITRR